jgi:acetyl-CoA synthetase/medium-chain acyl-CoA synthetase
MGVAVKRLRIGRRRVHAEQQSSPLELATAPALVDDRWRVPDHFNFTRDVVELLASDPKRRALTFSGHDGIIEPRTFLQMSEAAAHWASLLRERGVAPGDRVLVLVSGGASWLEVMLGCIKAGVVVVPCHPGSPASALEARVATTGASLIVADRVSDGAIAQMSFAPDVQLVEEAGSARSGEAEAPTHDTSSRDVAFVLWSSEAGGEPRAVAHTHGAAYASRVQAEHWLDAGPGDAVWCTADTGSAQAVWSGLLGPWSRGAEIIHHTGEFDALEQLDLIHRLGVTVLCQTPAEYRALADLKPRELERYRSRTLRRLVSTGDHLEPDVAALFEEVWELKVHDGYGQTETNVVVANAGTHVPYKPGSLGQALPGHHVAVVDDHGNELPPGVEGDLAVRGRPPTLFAGYWDSPDETKAAFSGDWYLTGDVAMRDEDGYLFHLGRADDVIASRGRTFGPYEVEAALRVHAAVRRAAVVGIPDHAHGGRFVRAYVVLEPRTKPSEQLAAELRQHVADALPEQQVPREVEFVDGLPTTPGGSVRRDELRERTVSGRPLWESVPAVEPPAAEAAFAAPAPEPEPAPPAPEPVPAAAPPEPAPVAEVEPAPVADAPLVLPETELPPPLEEPVFVSEEVATPFEDEVVIPLEPEVAIPVETEAIPLEPEAVVVPLVPEPEAPPEPEPPEELEPLPEYVVEPATEPEAPVEPEPPAASEPAEPEPPSVLPDYVVEPSYDPAPFAAHAEPAPEEEEDLGPLPEYVIDPERPTPLEAVPAPPPVAEAPAPVPPPAAEPDDDPRAGLGITPVTEFPQVDSGARREAPARRRISQPADKPDTQRSLGEPGDEGEEIGWMQGLSSRLSAYSLDTEPGAAGEPHDEDAGDAGDAETREDAE